MQDIATHLDAPMADHRHIPWSKVAYPNAPKSNSRLLVFKYKSSRPREGVLLADTETSDHGVSRPARHGRCLNLYAGPGVGKTTAMALLFGDLKQQRVNVEMVQEYAKELVWHGDQFDQQRIFEVQARRTSIAAKTDFIVSDGPLLQQLIYAEDPGLRRSIIAAYHRYENIDVLLTRSSKAVYDPRGRYPDAENLLFE